MTAILPGGELPAALADDPEILAAVKALTLDAIHQAQELMHDAIPSVKLQLIRVVLPAAAKALASPKGADANEELRGEMERMYDDVRGAIGAE